jgi:hypothetical protein
VKNCKGCKYAKWEKTVAGRLHPSGMGRCTFPWKMPPLPASMYFTGMSNPSLCGGWIERKRELKEHCPYYARETV